jgi:protein-S-isoprenylcysteine O-methyltransferase Ste14
MQTGSGRVARRADNTEGRPMTMPAPDAENGKDHAGVVVPPPLIFAGVLALALIADVIFAGPGFGLPATARIAIGLALLACGLVIGFSAITGFRAADTDVRPWKSSTSLVTSGFYRYTRNPMYLGMALIYAGLSLIADSVLALVCLLPLLVIINYAVIRREEHYLEVTFGQPYRDYKARVRRWI